MGTVKIFSTSGSEYLAEGILNEIKTRLPENMMHQKLGKVCFHYYSNENVEAELRENVRGTFCVVIHTQVPPVNDHLMELFGLLDAMKNSGAADILLVFPYMPYCRSDRKNRPRISTLGELIPEIISGVLGIKKVLLLDPHDAHLKHYFNPTADEITSIYLLARKIEEEIFSRYAKNDCVVVFADEGSVKRFKKMAYTLGIGSAYIDKDRPDNSETPAPNKVIGAVKGKMCILVDDEILTAGTVVSDAELLMSEGAKGVVSATVHAVLRNKKKASQELMALLEQSPIERFFFTNSIPIEGKDEFCGKTEIISVDALLGESISRIVLNQSISDLHDYKNVKLYV